MDKVHVQAYYLFKSGFRYWFDRDETATVNERNKEFAIQTTEDELVAQYCSPSMAEWYTATEVAEKIAQEAKYALGKASARDFGFALKKAGFHKKKLDGISRYAVSVTPSFRYHSPEIGVASGLESGVTESGYVETVGLVRCDRCGFGFQDWTGKAHGRWYPRYIDSGWKNKRQCEYLALDKEALESFAIQAVIESFSDPNVFRRVSGFLQMLFDSEPGQVQAECKRLEGEIKQLERRRENILTAIEQAADEDSVRSLTSRLTKLTQEWDELRVRMDLVNEEMHKKEQKRDVVSAVRTFTANFADRFNQSDVLERRMLLGKAISEIVVDRTDRLVRFYIRKVPAATPALAQILSKIEREEEFTAEVSARNRT